MSEFIEKEIPENVLPSIEEEKKAVERLLKIQANIKRALFSGLRPRNVRRTMGLTKGQYAYIMNLKDIK